MKKKLFYLAVIIIILSLIGGGTMAYFTASGTARNVIVTGSIKVEVVEKQLVNGKEENYPGGEIQIMPGSSVSKIVSARSLEQPAWVRMGYSMAVYDNEGKLLDIPADELAKAIIIKPVSSLWTEKGGWWYYEKAIGSGESTEPLFRSVDFSGPDMGNEYQNCTLVINVVAEAIQQANNGSTVMEATGWSD